MQPIIITNKGKQLVLDCITSGEKFTFTKIKTSSYQYESTEVALLTSLTDVKQEFLLSRTSVSNEIEVSLLATVTNEEVTKGYLIKAIGIYVETENEEILYGVSIETENFDYLPMYNGKTITGINYTFSLGVSNTECVNVSINPSLYATIGQVQELEDRVTVLEGVSDFGFFSENEVLVHNQSVNAHSSALVDGSVSSTSNISTLEEHIVDKVAHQNIILDGNEE